MEYWKKERKSWNWGKVFKKGVLQFAWPVIILIDLVNFFIIGDLNYAFISFDHLFYLIKKLLVFGALLGFAYGFFDWNGNERRYKRLTRQRPDEV